MPLKTEDSALSGSAQVELEPRRILALFPVVIESPFEDLFGENQEARRGPLIPRELLIPDFVFSPDMTEGLINRFLASVDYHRNPYLTPPE
jgi:hypothetical protein